MNLLAAFPEALTFNLNWPSAFPKAGHVLKTLLSLPEQFKSWDIFNHEAQKPERYVLRGLICFGHNHYFTFLRRIFHKLSYLGGLDYHQDLQEQADQIEQTEYRSS